MTRCPPGWSSWPIDQQRQYIQALLDKYEPLPSANWWDLGADWHAGVALLNDPNYHSPWKTVWGWDMRAADASCNFLADPESAGTGVVVCGGLVFTLGGDYSLDAASRTAISEIVTAKLGEVLPGDQEILKSDTFWSATAPKQGVVVLLQAGGRDLWIDYTWDQVYDFAAQRGLPLPNG